MSWKKLDIVAGHRKYVDFDKDEIYYFMEYTARKGYSHGTANNLISNLKMGPCQSPSRLKYRERAISVFSSNLRCFLSKAKVDVGITWVPPSQAPDDPKYDDRIVRAVNTSCVGLQYLHPMDIIFTKKTRARLHFDEFERDPIALAETYGWRDVDLNGVRVLIIVDDVLTQGTNFRAMADTIRGAYPNIHVVGMIWAITVWEEESYFDPINDE